MDKQIKIKVHHHKGLLKGILFLQPGQNDRLPKVRKKSYCLSALLIFTIANLFYVTLLPKQPPTYVEGWLWRARKVLH